MQLSPLLSRRVVHLAIHGSATLANRVWWPPCTPWCDDVIGVVVEVVVLAVVTMVAVVVAVVIVVIVVVVVAVVVFVIAVRKVFQRQRKYAFPILRNLS